ncbi:hypothetical protein VPHD51_0128 [Vibrio phage D51]
MKLLLFTLPSCYPCERAKKTLRDSFNHIPTTEYHLRSPVGKFMKIAASPTLLIVDDEGNVVGKLVGAHNITKINVQGLISDFFNC